MNKEYLVVLKAGVDKADYVSQVGEITVPQQHRPKLLICRLSEAQKLALESDSNVEDITNYRKLKSETLLVDCAARTISFNRPTGEMERDYIETASLGNYGLVRHTSQVNSIPATDTDASGTYTYEYDGTGVDLILNLASILDRFDPEFDRPNGATRLQNFQWNTLPGMEDVPTVDYTASRLTLPSDNEVDSHAEAVAYITCGNTYGWATGADIYVMPRNQIDLVDYGWDCMRLFHENKGNNRPTVVVDAIAYLKTHEFHRANNVLFRNQLHQELGADGAPLVTLGTHSGSVGTSQGTAFGCTPDMALHSGYSYDRQDGQPTASNIIDRVNNNYPSSSLRRVFIEPIEEMIAAGVHHISAVGNAGHAVHVEGHPDYNNSYTKWLKTNENLDYSRTYQADWLYTYNRASFVVAGDTIAVGALASRWRNDDYNGQETLAGFSNRGTRVDCVAAGDNIYMELRNNGYYNATGTSFASPQIGGMACLVLEKYPTTTPAQLRKYFRDHAVGQDTLHDSGLQPVSSSSRGDSAYFMDWGGLQGYSGNIAYLDPDLTFDPTTITITDTSFTDATGLVDNKINYTTAEINTKLGTI